MMKVKKAHVDKTKTKELVQAEDSEKNKNVSEAVKEPRESKKLKKVEAADRHDEEDEEEELKGKVWKKVIVIVVVLGILGAGGYFVKSFLTKTTVVTETVQLSTDARGFSNYFKEYLSDRIKAEVLFNHTYKESSTDVILSELSSLKDGFSKVSRGVGDNYKTSDYKELAEVMASDSLIYLSAVRELRNVMTDGYETLEERQKAFENKVKETTQGLRSAFYDAQSGFEGDVSGLSSKGVIMFNGGVLVEVGGGVMNIMLGDFDISMTVVTTDDMEETVKSIEAQKLYGYASSRLVKIGEGLGAMLEPGWVKNIKLDVRSRDAEITTTKISLVMKNASGVNDELKGQGIEGFSGADKKSEIDLLEGFVKGLKGKK